MIITLESFNRKIVRKLRKDIANHFSLEDLDIEVEDFDLNSLDIFSLKNNNIALKILEAKILEYSKSDNFVSDGFSIFEEARKNIIKKYTKQLNQFEGQYLPKNVSPSLFKLDCTGIEKNILILIDDLNFSHFKQYYPQYKIIEKNTITTKFTEFRDAFKKSVIPTKNIVLFDGDYNKLLKDTINAINYVKNDELMTLQNNILKCKLCPLIENCKKINPEWGKPFLPYIKGKKYMFIDISPDIFSIKDRENETLDPFSNRREANLIFEKLKQLCLLNSSYLTTLVKCNTLENEKTEIDEECLIKCSMKFLVKEIELVNPEIIFLLGTQRTSSLFRKIFHGRVCLGRKVIDIFNPTIQNFTLNREEYGKYRAKKFVEILKNELNLGKKNLNS